MSLEVEVKLEYATIEASLEAVSLGHLPLLVDDGEGDVFVGYPSAEPDGEGVGSTVWLQIELRRLGLVGQVGVEDVELVALNDLGRRVLRVIMRLVVLVPLVTLLDTVEEPRLPHDKELFMALL